MYQPNNGYYNNYYANYNSNTAPQQQQQPYGVDGTSAQHYYSNSNNSYYPQPISSTSFVAAPAPILLDDGDVTVVSALTTATARPNPAYNYQPSHQNFPSTSFNQPPAPPMSPTENSGPKYDPGPPKTIDTSSSSASPASRPNDNHNNISQELIYPMNQYPRDPVDQYPRRATYPNNSSSVPQISSTKLTAGNTSTTLTTYNGALEGPHRTYPIEVEKMKLRRKRYTVAAGVAGGVVGLVAAGPLGAVVVGAGASAVVRTAGKRKERKKRDKIADRIIAEQQRGAPECLVHSGAFL